jgi:hypothetical protein
LTRRGFLFSGIGAICAAQEMPVVPMDKWPDDKIEVYLREAKIIKKKNLNTGVTGSRKFTLQLRNITADAHFQSVDEAKQKFQSAGGTEFNFRDTWKFNVAAYKLDRLLNLRMVPPCVERKVNGDNGALSVWIPGAMMEAERLKKKQRPSDADFWNKQLYSVRVFDQLIFNTDRNLQNLLITPDWRIWMIDHTRAFRTHSDLKEPRNLTKCERGLLARLKSLTEPEVATATKPYLERWEIQGIVKRRDKIVEIFEKKIADEGESNILYDFTRS